MKIQTRTGVHPAKIIVPSFALVILVATVLLSLPAATVGEGRMSIVDAFFTATSATCVSGFVVLHTGQDLTVFGQLVILICIQIGGLGLMSFTTIFMLMVAHRLSIGDRFALQESFHHSPSSSVARLLTYIVVTTFVLEAIGAGILAVHWWRQERFATFGETLYNAVFHAVSAFCNAGFTLFADSLVEFQQDPVVMMTMSLLIVFGGLGFLVGLDIHQYLQQTLFTRFWTRRKRELVESFRPRPRLSLHSKFVLVTSAALLVIGTVSYAVLERQGAFAHMDAGSTWMNAWFASVTARSSGFHAVDYNLMGSAALLCTMVLMLIGASPGSTGGGIKTSTFALLVAYSISRFRGNPTVTAFGRSVPDEARDRAAGVVVGIVVLVILSSSFLMATETFRLPPEQGHNMFLPVLFEAVSASGNVGLSMGQTPQLSDAGRIVMCFVMFMGRIGPITVALAVARRQRRRHYRYAEENLMIG